jgi:hypothetical protein
LKYEKVQYLGNLDNSTIVPSTDFDDNLFSINKEIVQVYMHAYIDLKGALGRAVQNNFWHENAIDLETYLNLQTPEIACVELEHNTK